ncbi:MAG: phage virion morphogenesis protein [Magnetococcus sp. DMHC-1]|nr:phage virion morphogenesis protein [Magnetococcales bacterium]
MSGISLQFDIDDDTLRQVLEGLATRAGDLTPAMKTIGENLVRVTQARFDAQERPDGVDWEKNQPEYWATKRIKKILTEDSGLRDSIVYRESPDGVTVGTHKIYAAIHQFGGTILPVKGKYLRFKIGDQAVYAKQVTIPARPFLGITPDGQEEVVATIKDFLLGDTA